MATKKAVAAVDARIEAIVREEYSDFEQYLPMLQDKAMYRRKQNEYWEKINARVKEELGDGRATDKQRVVGAQRPTAQSIARAKLV